MCPRLPGTGFRQCCRNELIGLRQINCARIMFPLQQILKRRIRNGGKKIPELAQAGWGCLAK